MLKKLTRVDLLHAHTVLVGQIEDHEVVPFELCEPRADEIRARTSDLYELLTAVLDYADVVMADTYAHLGAATIYAPPHLAAMRNETAVLHRLLTAHADVIEKREQYDHQQAQELPNHSNASHYSG